MPNSMSNKPGFYDDSSSSAKKSSINPDGSHKESAKLGATKNLNQRFFPQIHPITAFTNCKFFFNHFTVQALTAAGSVAYGINYL